MFAATVALFEESMLDPTREARQTIRAVIHRAVNGDPELDGNVPQPADRHHSADARIDPPPRRATPLRRHPVTDPDENPFGDTVYLPPGFKEQPLG